MVRDDGLAVAFVSYTRRDNVAEVMLNNPPVNALTEPVMDDLITALARARDDRSVRAVIIGSAFPDRFCAGLDLQAVHTLPPEGLRALVDKLYVRLNDVQVSLGKPSIAAIPGATRGGGMTVAISCDMIVAADTATFAYPEIDIGLVPAIHYTHLHRILGRYRAFDLLFTGRVLSAQDAVDLGLISRLAKPGQVLDEARKLAQVLASKPPEVMNLGRAAFLEAIDTGYRRGVAGAVDTVCTVAATEDAKEGVAAYIEKRKPKWPSR